ncbi:MAG: hypothetical protein ABI462_12080 [Ignavibacteria bacterium]
MKFMLITFAVLLIFISCSDKKNSNIIINSEENDPGYRVVVEPHQAETMLPPHTTDWQLVYKMRVPVLPTGSWNANNQTIYTYGQVDFDRYGAGGPDSISHYLYNQIVPQVMMGNCLDSNTSDYTPGWHIHSDWVIQAQYYWMGSDTVSHALCGNLVRVFPHEELTETISYNSSSGVITASLSGSGGTSSITIPRPFPNEDTLFTNWADFFARAENKSQTSGAYGQAVLNVETHYVVEETICSFLPFIVNHVSIPGIPWQEGNYRIRRDGQYTCPDTLANRLAILYYN